MNIDLTPIIQAVIALLAAIVTYKLIPWIKAKTTNEQQAMIKAAIKTAVFAAEQLYGAGEGAKKLDFVVKWLEDHGYTANRVEIEAAVRECINNFPVIEAVDYGTETTDSE